MRRLRALVWGLPADAIVRKAMAVDRSSTEVPAPVPKQVDYDALRAMGGEVIKIPRKAG